MNSQVGLEALDDPSTDPLLVERMLREIARSNRWFGGRAAVRAGLQSLCTEADRGSELVLLDLGTGEGDLPRWARGWALQRGIALRILGLERLPAAASLAHRSGVPVVLGCAGTLPVRDRSVDIVLLSQLVHHFDDAGIVRLFCEASRVARRGVVVAELRPSAVAGLAYRVAGRVMGFHQTTIDDGVTSLARGLNRSRLEVLAAGQGHDLVIRPLPFARVMASWRTTR